MNLLDKLRFAARVLDENRCQQSGRIYRMTVAEADEFKDAHSPGNPGDYLYGIKMLAPLCPRCGK